MKKNISFAILTLNEEKNIENALKSIPFENLKNTAIYDGGSSDKTKYIVEKFNVKFISLPSTSIEYRRNFAIQSSETELICFLDADQHFAVETNFNQICKKFDLDPLLGGIQFNVIGNSENSYWAKGFGLRHKILHKSQINNIVMGTPCIFLVSLLKDIKAYKDGITGPSDDTMACLRIREKGFKLRTINEIAYENVRSGLRGTLKKSFWYGKGDYEYVKKLKKFKNIVNHLFHVFIRNPLIIPLKVLFSNDIFYFTFFILFGFVRASGFVFSMFNANDLSKEKT